MIKKMILYRYTAYCNDAEKPENLYHFARENGSCQSIWVYNDIMEALKALQDFGTTCELKQEYPPCWEIVCYALEPEDAT